MEKGIASEFLNNTQLLFRLFEGVQKVAFLNTSIDADS